MVDAIYQYLYRATMSLHKTTWEEPTSDVVNVEVKGTNWFVFTLILFLWSTVRQLYHSII